MDARRRNAPSVALLRRLAAAADRGDDRLPDYVASIRADLELLLNARRARSIDRDRFPEIERSVLGWGLPDAISANLGDPVARDAYAEEIHRAIVAFEPRLTAVEVALEHDRSIDAHMLSFRIIARLATVPDQPAVAFETAFEPGSEHLKVERSVV